MKTLILGGTYNPVHIGHLYLAEEARTQFGYEQVIFVPSNIPAHKDHDPCISTDHRLEMLRASTEGTDFIVDECEILRGGVSYTYETLREIHAKYNISGRPGLVVGDDLVEGLSHWKMWSHWHEMVDLIIAHRLYAEQVYCPFRHSYVDNLILPISSSDIRERRRVGKPIRYLVPEPVYQIIIRERLYEEC